MKKTFFIPLTLFLFVYSASLNAQDSSWRKDVREHKTIKNITYYFPAEIDMNKRQSVIDLCQKSIVENLALLKETEFSNKMDFEVLNSRGEMLKYAGRSAQGRAMYAQNTMFTLLTKNAPIKHEMMHMMAMYIWGDSIDYWIDEGLATYSGGTCSDYSLEQIYQYYLQAGKLIPITALTTDDFLKQNDIIAYTQSAYLVKYLLDNYGYEKFKRLWREGFINFAEIYGFEYAKLDIQIKSEFALKYPKNIDFNWEEFDKGCN